MNTLQQAEPCLGKYAFLVHPTSLDDLYASGPSGLANLTPRQRQNWQRWISSWSQHRYEPGIAYHLPKLRSQAGGYVEGWLIGIPLTPAQMMQLPPLEVRHLLEKCVQLARSLKVDMLGLGAFTSIISRGGTYLVGCGVHVTTGNGLTGMAAAEGLKLAARRRGRDLSEAEIAVIGAAGSVGRLACKRLAAECRRLTLFGNPAKPASMQKLRALAGELYQDSIGRTIAGAISGIGRELPSIPSIEAAYYASLENRCSETLCRLHDAVAEDAARAGVAPPITVTLDLKRELPRMKFVVSATSQGKAFIDADVLAPGAVVCDAERPADVVAEVRKSRPDVFVYEGALMRLPQRVAFGRRNVVGCPPGVNLACLSETITLTMSGVRRDVSIGIEPPFADALEVFQHAQRHGFEVFVPEASSTPS